MESAPTTPPTVSRGSRGWKTALKWTLCAIALVLVFRAMKKQFAGIDWSTLEIRPSMVMLSALCAIGWATMRGLSMGMLLSAYEKPLPWRKVMGIQWLSQLGKYLPGKVGSVAGAVLLLREHGASAAAGMSAVALVGGFSILTSMMVSSPLLVWHPALRERFPFGVFIAAICIGAGLVCMHPRVFGAVMNSAMRRFKGRPLDTLPAARQFIGPMLAAFGQWIFAGLGLWFAAAAVTDVPVKTIPIFIASASLGLTLGYLALFAPAGIGVRELVIVTVLGSVVGPTIAVSALLLRLIHTFCDLLLAAAGAWMLRTPAVTPFPENSPEAIPPWPSIPENSSRS